MFAPGTLLYGAGRTNNPEPYLTEFDVHVVKGYDEVDRVHTLVAGQHEQSDSPPEQPPAHSNPCLSKLHSEERKLNTPRPCEKSSETLAREA